jgi:hypothetical protein
MPLVERINRCAGISSEKTDFPAAEVAGGFVRFIANFPVLQGKRNGKVLARFLLALWRFSHMSAGSVPMHRKPFHES